jgi:hypothetical protein
VLRDYSTIQWRARLEISRRVKTRPVFIAGRARIETITRLRQQRHAGMQIQTGPQRHLKHGRLRLLMKETERSIFEEQCRVAAVESARHTISVDGVRGHGWKLWRPTTYRILAALHPLDPFPGSDIMFKQWATDANKPPEPPLPIQEHRLTRSVQRTRRCLSLAARASI